jgi:hypothetical protein
MVVLVEVMQMEVVIAHEALRSPERSVISGSRCKTAYFVKSAILVTRRLES